MSKTESVSSFKSLGLPPALIQALEDVGYEIPTPIQLGAIPPLMSGGDLIGHAPTLLRLLPPTGLGSGSGVD